MQTLSEIADNVPEETAAISKARAIAVRKWIASAMDPDQWNTTRTNQQVQVNIHAQHLDALRKVQAEVIEHEGDWGLNYLAWADDFVVIVRKDDRLVTVGNTSSATCMN